MSSSKWAWMVWGASGAIVASTTWLAACSSSSSGNQGAADSGTSGGDSSMSTDTGTTGDDTGTSSGGGDSATATDSGADVACENPPKLYPQQMPGVYCPFLPADASANSSCAPGQHCCEAPASMSGSPSSCEAIGTACPANYIDWQCSEAIDCTAVDGGGSVCCGTGMPTSVSSCGQTWREWNGFTGTTCAASCPSPGITVCQQASDCTAADAGATCSVSKTNGSDFGYCGP